MRRDYIPANDELFESWMQNFVSGLTVHAGVLDVDMAEIAAMSTARNDLDSSIADHVTKRAASKSATALKNEKRGTAETMVRTMVRRIVGNPAMTDAIRADLGLNIPDSTQTPSTNTVGPEIPKIYLEALPGRVRVHFGTNPGNKRLNTKPAWAMGCAIYRKRVDESGFRLVGFQAKSPFTDDIVGPGSDYTYYVRYQGKDATDLSAESSIAVIAASGLMAA